MKLTPLQKEALRAVAAGTVKMSNHGYSAFRTSGASGSVVGRLVSLGLVKWPKGPVGTQTCEITDAGREALASLLGEGEPT